MASSRRNWVLSALVWAILTTHAHAQGSRGTDQAGAVVLQETMAESIVSREEGAAGRPFDARYRAAVKVALTARSVIELASITAGLGPRILGDNATSLVFTPVPPCRIIDTTVLPAPLAAGSQIGFVVAGTQFFPEQGGQPGGCGIPFGPATAAMINFVAVGPANAGDLRAFAFGSPVPNASIINYASVPGLNIANGLAVPICNPAVLNCSSDLAIQVDVSDTDLVADVVGYFAAADPVPMWAVVTSAGTLVRGFRAVAASRPLLGQYNVVFDRNVANCGYVATIGAPGTGNENPGSISVASLLTSVNGVYVEIRNVPGALDDRGFHVAVHC
jgi:hypothetical protein